MVAFISAWVFIATQDFTATWFLYHKLVKNINMKLSELRDHASSWASTLCFNFASVHTCIGTYVPCFAHTYKYSLVYHECYSKISYIHYCFAACSLSVKCNFTPNNEFITELVYKDMRVILCLHSNKYCVAGRRPFCSSSEWGGARTKYGIVSQIDKVAYSNVCICCKRGKAKSNKTCKTSKTCFAAVPIPSWHLMQHLTRAGCSERAGTAFQHQSTWIRPSRPPLVDTPQERTQRMLFQKTT